MASLITSTKLGTIMKPNWARLSWHKTDGFNSGLLMTDVLTLDPGHERQWAAFCQGRAKPSSACSSSSLALSSSSGVVCGWYQLQLATRARSNLIQSSTKSLLMTRLASFLPPCVCSAQISGYRTVNIICAFNSPIFSFQRPPT